MLVNRDEFPMMAGQPAFLGMQPPQDVAQAKQDEDGLMVRFMSSHLAHHFSQCTIDTSAGRLATQPRAGITDIKLNTWQAHVCSIIHRGRLPWRCVHSEFQQYHDAGRLGGRCGAS